MNKIFLILFATGMLLVPVMGYPQSWQWGISNTLSFAGFVEASQTVTDNSGNAFVAGSYGFGDSMTIGAFTLYNTIHTDQLFVVKTNPSGVVQWVAGTHNSYSTPVAMATDETGNLYLLGEYIDTSCTLGAYTMHNPSHYIMYFIAKFSPGGTVAWAQNIAGNHTFASSAGGIGVDGLGYIYATGTFNLPTATIGTTTLLNTTIAGDSADVFLAKYDNLGNNIWAKSYGGHGNDMANALSVANNGDLFISGVFSGHSITVGTDTLSDSLTSMLTYFRGFPYFARFDRGGHPVWAKCPPRHIFIKSLTVDAQENIYLTGALDSSIVMGADTILAPTGHSMFVARYDSAGNFAWANSAQGIWGGSESYSVAADSCGNAWVAGTTQGQIIIDGYTIDTPAAYSDLMFVAAFDHCGRYIPGTGQELPSGGDDLMQITLDPSGNLYLGGDYTRVPMIFGTDTLRYPGPMYEYLLFAKYQTGPILCDTPCFPSPVTLGTKPRTSPQIGIMIFPNPATAECTISSDTTFPPGSIAEVYDMTGRLVKKYALSGSTTVFSVNELASGIYQCRIISFTGLIAVKKLVVIK